jgi:uncharacterized membrane protein YqjE
LLRFGVMATVHRLPAPIETHPAPHDESVLSGLAKILKLELELAVAETREVLVAAAIAIAVAVPAAVLLLAALVVLIAAAFAPLFGAHWQHLVIAGGGVLLLALAALAWSAWRLTHLSWPKEIVASLQENWQWLGAQLRSRLTLR